MSVNKYVKGVFSAPEVVEKWGRAGMYDPETNDGLFKYNDKLYRMQYVLDFIPNAQSEKSLALDLGCGGGVYVPYLTQKGYKVTALDISNKMVEKSRILCNTLSIEANIIIGDCSSTNFPDSYFDLILCVGLIEHQSENSPLLKEVNRILKLGGTLVLTFRNFLCPHIRFRYLMADFIHSGINAVRRMRGKKPLKRGDDGYTKSWDSREHSPFQLAREFRRHGFVVRSSRYSHFYFLPFPLDRKLGYIEFLISKKLEALSRSPLRWLGSTGVFLAKKETS